MAAGADDDDVLARAADEDRVLVTTDTDFGTLLALSGAPTPSVILLRGVGDSVDERVAAVLQALPAVKPDLEQGAIAAVESDRIRIRTLPITDA